MISNMSDIVETPTPGSFTHTDEAGLTALRQMQQYHSPQQGGSVELWGPQYRPHQKKKNTQPLGERLSEFGRTAAKEKRRPDQDLLPLVDEECNTHPKVKGGWKQADSDGHDVSYREELPCLLVNTDIRVGKKLMATSFKTTN